MAVNLFSKPRKKVTKYGVFRFFGQIQNCAKYIKMRQKNTVTETKMCKEIQHC